MKVERTSSWEETIERKLCNRLGGAGLRDLGPMSGDLRKLKGSCNERINQNSLNSNIWWNILMFSHLFMRLVYGEYLVIATGHYGSLRQRTLLVFVIDRSSHSVYLNIMHKITNL